MKNLRVSVHPWTTLAWPRCAGLMLAICTLGMTGCASTPSTGNQGPTATTGVLPTVTSAPTATAMPACEQLVAGATPASTVSGVPGIQLPSGTYSSAATQTGGGTGQYILQTYTLCFQGTASAVVGGPTSTIGLLEQNNGWVVNNLFPDSTNFAYLDYCSAGGGSAHLCVNTPGTPSPFTFASFDQFASHSGGYTTFRLQVATISVPTCSSDPQYYSGTPKYTLYQDGNSAASSHPTYHFQMPPGTRVSSFLGGGTAGSTYVYYCSAGTQASILTFLKQSMQYDGYTISSVTSTGFMASTGSNPTFSIQVDVTNAQNYYLRVFVPM